MAHDHNPLYLGAFENGEPAWISTADRRRHLYVIGRSGTGKSQLLRNLMLDDFVRRRPFALFDPHGDLSIQIASSVPSERTNQVLFIDLSNSDHLVGLNPLHGVPLHERPTAAAHVMATFIHTWQLSVDINARLLNVLNAGLRLLLDSPGSTLLGLQKMLIDLSYRKRLIANCTDPVIEQFWTQEVERYSERYEVEAFAPLQSRLNLLLSHPITRQIISQRTTIDVGRLMDEGQSLILRIPRGKLGEVPTYLLGALFATAFAQAAEARADQPEEERRDFALILDEAEYFATTSLVDVLSGSRKYRLQMVLAHQFLAQLPEMLRQAIPANAGSVICFEVSSADAAILAPELAAFDPLMEHSGLQAANRGVFDPAQLTNMAPFSAWVRLMQDGKRGERRLLFPEFLDRVSRKRFEAVRNNSINTYTRPRAGIARKVERFLDRRVGP